MSQSNEIRPLVGDEIDEYVAFSADAYPGFPVITAEERRAMRERLELRLQDSRYSLFGLFRNGRLVGGMRLHRYTMTYGQIAVPLAGLAAVAVHPLFRKQGVAKEMVRYFHASARQEGMALAALYPFRPDFYRRMAYGYGTKKDQYQLRPQTFPRGHTSNLSQASEDDREAILACYNRFAGITHGMFARPLSDFQFDPTDTKMRGVVYREGETVLGYILYEYRPAEGGSFLTNDIYIYEMIYETPAALAQLLAFLNGQQDQIRAIILPTFDEQIHHLLADPRTLNERIIRSTFHESNIQGVGLMYKVLDVPAMLRQLADRGHTFGGKDLRLRLQVDDEFFAESAGVTVLHVESGRIQAISGDDDSDYDVAVRLSIGHFSSWLMGAADLTSLVRYGVATISQPGMLPAVDRLFNTGAKPICMTGF